MIVNDWIEPSPRIAVAAAPTPLPPLNVIVGGTVYPAPAFVIRTSNIELDVVIATAVASVPPTGAVEIATVGAEVYAYHHCLEQCF